MSAEVESMMYVGHTPWHGQGVKLANPPTAEEAIRAAGLDWDVALCPVSADVLGDDGATELVSVPNYRAVRRVSDGRIYAVVSDGFRPLQNREAFGFFDGMIASGSAEYETAGALRDGARIWVLVKLALPHAEIVPGDRVDAYALLSNSHDGSLAVRAGFTNVRVVCSNTLAASHSQGRYIRIKHTTNVKENLDVVRDTMHVARRTFETTVEQYRRLADVGINQDDFRAYVAEVFAPEEKPAIEESESALTARLLGGAVQNETTEQATDRLLGRAPRNIEKVTECFESGAGHELAGKTLWGAYNAVTEYVQHVRGNDAAKRLDSAWFGQGDKVNVRALSLALKRANAA